MSAPVTPDVLGESLGAVVERCLNREAHWRYLACLPIPGCQRGVDELAEKCNERGNCDILAERSEYDALIWADHFLSARASIAKAVHYLQKLNHPARVEARLRSKAE